MQVSSCQKSVWNDGRRGASLASARRRQYDLLVYQLGRCHRTRQRTCVSQRLHRRKSLFSAYRIGPKVCKWRNIGCCNYSRDIKVKMLKSKPVIPVYERYEEEIRAQQDVYEFFEREAEARIVFYFFNCRLSVHKEPG